jgi:hypothetical protein
MKTRIISNLCFMFSFVNSEAASVFSFLFFLTHTHTNKDRYTEKIYIDFKNTHSLIKKKKIQNLSHSIR